jgi:porphobilinogen synthase
VVPLFILEGENHKQAIHSMPGIERMSIDLALREVENLFKSGIQAVDLFPVIPSEKKDAAATEALREDNLVCRAIQALKKEFPDLCIMVDVALDPYTSHGHDGLVDDSGYVINDPTVEVLARMSVLAAAAGADVIAPSDMMDGRVAYIRGALDDAGFEQVSILSYAAKYASAFYGPFRDALGSAPKFGDKKQYQMDPANVREALLECALDEAEGADMLLIKPGLPYLDVIAKVRAQTQLPLGAYHVSGEYAMVMAAGEKGWINPVRCMHESLMALKRAGADFILTYAAKMMLENGLI